LAIVVNEKGLERRWRRPESARLAIRIRFLPIQRANAHMTRDESRLLVETIEERNGGGKSRLLIYISMALESLR